MFCLFDSLSHRKQINRLILKMLIWMPLHLALLILW